MSQTTATGSFFIGWDVGGWNCDKNPRSRDAVVILDQSLSIVGNPWRGNLRTHINESENTSAWIGRLFDLCNAHRAGDNSRNYLAIDTPLGFSEDFAQLVTRLSHTSSLGRSASNPYLFRMTERELFRRGLTPLSAVKDMIGSQATKGMHVLAKFAPDAASCGVWTDGSLLTAVEAYPSACSGSATMSGLRAQFEAVGHDDKEDALTCALIAYLFAEKPDLLSGPEDNTPLQEGWIWIPKDSTD